MAGKSGTQPKDIGSCPDAGHYPWQKEKPDVLASGKSQPIN